MKRSIITLGTLFCVFFIVSTGTAVPQVQNNLINDKINQFSYIENKLQDKILEINTHISQIIKDIDTLGLIDNLINLLIKIIEFILKIGEFISSILSIGVRILAFVNQIIYILETVINIINWILDLFNPQQVLFNIK